MYPIIALFLQEIVAPLGICAEAVASFLALCDVLDMLVHAQEGLVTPEELQAVIINHLTLYTAAYGEIGWVYKFHAALHLADQLARLGLLIALFTLERRHKVVKRYVHDRRPNPSFELGLIEDITLQHLFDMKTRWWKDQLDNPVTPKPKMLEAILAAIPSAVSAVVSRETTLWTGYSVHAGDIVACVHGDAHVVAELYFVATITHVSGHEEDVACVSIWPRTAGGTSYYRNFTVINAPFVVPLGHLSEALIYSSNSDNTVVSCIIPAPLRKHFA